MIISMIIQYVVVYQYDTTRFCRIVEAYTSILTPCLVLALAILVHAWDLNCSLTGLSNWRELQLTSEFAEYPGGKATNNNIINNNIIRNNNIDTFNSRKI